jgi:hypothetical protein
MFADENERKKSRKIRESTIKTLFGPASEDRGGGRLCTVGLFQRDEAPEAVSFLSSLRPRALFRYFERKQPFGRGDRP